MEGTFPNSALRRLVPLVGEWELQVSIGDHVVAHARTTFEWVETGAFLRERSEGEIAEVAPPEWAMNGPFPLTTVIGLDDATETFTMLYADARDVCRVYWMTLDGGRWKMWRDSPGFHQRFSGRFSDGGGLITGSWEGSRDGKTWWPDFDLTYSRILEAP